MKTLVSTLAYAILFVSLFFLYFISPVTYFIIASAGVAIIIHEILYMMFGYNIKNFLLYVVRWIRKASEKIHVPGVEHVNPALN